MSPPLSWTCRSPLPNQPELSNCMPLFKQMGLYNICDKCSTLLCKGVVFPSFCRQQDSDVRKKTEPKNFKELINITRSHTIFLESVSATLCDQEKCQASHIWWRTASGHLHCSTPPLQSLEAYTHKHKNLYTYLYDICMHRHIHTPNTCMHTHTHTHNVHAHSHTHICVYTNTHRPTHAHK